MKNGLMYCACMIFMLALVLLSQTMIMYAIVGIAVAITLVVSSCLMAKEEECYNLINNNIDLIRDNQQLMKDNTQLLKYKKALDDLSHRVGIRVIV